jgi:predicted KAP-like P-loop ATPase
MQIFNVDKPINSSAEDKLDRACFVNNLANAIIDYKDKESLTIGLCGKWGTGKTSILNLIEAKLKDEKYKIIKFNPWNFKEQDELIQAFFKELYQQLNYVDDHKVFTKFSLFFKRIFHILSFGQYIPSIAPHAVLLAPLIKEYANLLDNLTFKKSLEEVKNKIEKVLRKIAKKNKNRKIIVFIDDIDRLNDKEIAQIFQLTKLIANFENLIYVLSFDKNVVVSALKNSQKEFAENYLDKIIQVPLKVPEVSLFKIQNTLIDKMNKSISNIREFESYRNGELENTGFWLQFGTIREVNRFLNIFNFKFHSLKDNVDFHDFCVVTLLELKFPKVYNFIFEHKKIITGDYSLYSSNDEDKKRIESVVKTFIESIRDEHNSIDNAFIYESLKFLFPKIRTCTTSYSLYAHVMPQEAKVRGYIQEDSNFDYYFNFYNPEEITNSKIEESIKEYDKEQFLEFVKILIKNQEFSNYLSFMNYYIENDLDVERSKNLFEWILGISSLIEKDKDLKSLFVLDSESQIGYFLLSFLRNHKQDFNIFQYIKQFFIEGKLTLCKVNILRSLQNEHGRMSKRQTALRDNPVLTEKQVIELEKIVKPNLKIALSAPESLELKDYVQYYYLMKSIDEKFCNNLQNEYLKSDEYCFKFVNKFVSRGQYITGSKANTYHYNIDSLKEDFDCDFVYKKLKPLITKDIDLNNEDNVIKMAYIMSYEKAGDRDGYTVAAMKKYLKDNIK